MPAAESVAPEPFESLEMMEPAMSVEPCESVPRDSNKIPCAQVEETEVSETCSTEN